MKRINCLLSKNGKTVQLIGAAMRDMANTILLAKADAKITVPDLYKRLKDHGVDIDMESTAYIYADVFAKDINQYDNFHTEDELLEFSKKYPPVSAGVKKALIDAGFKKTLKNGKEIIDWTKLMRKSEDEIKEEIKNAGLVNEGEVFNSLQDEWKQIVSTALIKAKNSLAQKNTTVSPSELNAIDRLADLHVKGLFSDFKDDYNNAVRKAIGTSRETLADLSELDQLGRTARLLQQQGFGTNNDLGNKLQADVNKVIAKARYNAADGKWIFKATKFVSDLFDMANLAMLNNPANRGQNFLSGHVELNSAAVNYGYAPKEVKHLSVELKRDIIRNGAEDAGDVNNIFHGNHHVADKVREKMTGWINDKDQKVSYERASNWAFNQLFGIAALNGVDNAMKVKNTWTRFSWAMENILVSDQGMTKREAREKLNNELFGEKWEQAREKAAHVMADIKAKGGSIEINPQSVERFTADVVKAQLISNGIITAEQLNAAWDASYRAAGRAMGHIPNNVVTLLLNKVKGHFSDMVERNIAKGRFNHAIVPMMLDIVLNKMVYRFMGGGTNWLFLKMEKGGLGIFSGLYNTLEGKEDFRESGNVANMTQKELEESIYHAEKAQDKIARGAAGLLTNALLLTTALMILNSGGGGDDDDDLKHKLVNWLNNNKWANKYVNNWIPFYLTAMVAYEKQKQSNAGLAGWSKRYSPAKSYAYNFVNQQEGSKLEDLMQASSKFFSDDDEKRQTARGKIGIIAGGYFNMNPLPYRIIEDTYKAFEGMAGNLNEQYVTPKTVLEGYFKFGMFDTPRLENKEPAFGGAGVSNDY